MRLDTFLSDTELEYIQELKDKNGSQWNDTKFRNSIYPKIKSALRSEVGKCCYCDRSFTAEFNMVIDIEHVLPKAIFTELEFEERNLSLACKRCNMNIKKDDLSFLSNSNKAYVLTVPYVINNFEIPHPTQERYYNHLSRFQLQFEEFMFVKYLINEGTKGGYTYRYFKLDEFEEESYNLVQGIKADDQLDQFPIHIRQQITQLFD